MITAEAEETVARPAQQRSSRRSVIALAVGVLAVPVVGDLLVSGRRRVFSYFAADAFYYLVVARNWALHGVVSFDGHRPTNGFHPLWQVLLTGLYRVTTAAGGGTTAVLYVDLFTGVVLVALALVLLGRAIALARGRLTPWFAAVPLGAYALLLLPLWLGYGAADALNRDPFEGNLPLYGTLWSYVNGMETPLVLACFGLVVLLAVRSVWTGQRQAVLVGVALGLMTLARLDTAFVTAAVLAMFALRALVRRDRASVRQAVAVVVPVAVLLGAYLVWTRAYSGTFLPVSGSLKSTFPNASLGNYRDLRGLLRGDALLAHERLYRQMPILIPSAFAIAYLVGGLARGWLRAAVTGAAEVARERYRLVLAASAVGVLLLSVYDYLFVPGYNQGHWYWPVSTLFVSLVVLDWLPARPSRVPYGAAVVGAIAVAASLAVFATLGRTSDYHARYADFYFSGAMRARAHYDGHQPKVLSVDDGIDVFATGFPGMSGTGFSLDPPAARAKERGDLVGLAVRRGFDRISSLVYFDTRGLSLDTSSSDIRARLRFILPGQHLDRFDYRVDYLASDPRFAIIRVTPRR